MFEATDLQVMQKYVRPHNFRFYEFPEDFPAERRPNRKPEMKRSTAIFQVVTSVDHPQI